MRNLYKVLGVASKADDQRIKAAFRRRAKAVHPDLNPGNRRAEARFIELMQAYEVLGDADNRAAYDTCLADWRRQARRRYAHCAGLMMTSFVLTATSALVVMGIAGANVPYRETWQLAVQAVSPVGKAGDVRSGEGGAQKGKAGAGWGAQVAAAADSAKPSDVPDGAVRAPDAKVVPSRHAKADVGRAAAPSRAPGARGRQGIADAAAKEPRQQHVAAASKPASAPSKRAEPAAPPASASQDSWWPSPASDEPRYSLGASDLR